MHTTTTTISTTVRRPRWSALLAATALAAGMVTVSGCGGDDNPAALPEATTGATTTPTTPTVDRDADERAAVTALERYEAVVNDITGGGPLTMARLEQVATTPWAITVFKNLDQARSADLVSRGPIRGELLSVTVTGDRASVLKCLDGRQRLTVEKGEKPVAGQTGPDPAVYTASLVMRDGAWLVTGSKEGKRCSVGS
ncbi:MAG: hypothetical protein ACRC35_04265 [Angustibacter sp.]